MRKNVLLIIVCAIVLTAAAAAPFVVKYATEKKAEEEFRATYGSHSDFETIYKVLQENKALIKGNPRNDAAYDSLAQGYYVLNAFEYARDAMLKATELKPDNDSYWSRLGRVYQAKKEYPKAASAYERALQVNPKKKDHYKALSWLYYFRFEGSDRVKAFPVLEKGLQAFPNDKDLLFDITRYHLYDNNVQEFLKYAPQYLAVNPFDKAMQKDYENMKKTMAGDVKKGKK